MITTHIVFDHRGRTSKGEEGPVEIRVTIDRKPYYINTGVRVPKNRLKAGIIVDDIRSNDAFILNERLRIISGRVVAEINDCLATGRPIDVKAVRSKIWANVTDSRNGDTDEQTVVEWIREQVPLMGLSPGRMKHYTTLRTRMLEYGELMYWRDMTVENIYKWDAWLHGLKLKISENQKKAGIKTKPISQGAIWNYHKNLRAILNRAVKLGVIVASPYDRMKGEIKRGEKVTVDYLTREQLKSIESLELRPGSQLDMARDIFVFQAYTGLAYSDAQAFNIKGYKEVDGRWVSIGTRIKTGVPYVSQLLPQAVDVLEKNSWSVPKMNNIRYNAKLKEIGNMVGVSGLHSHMARHTFATWMLSMGAKIENVSKMLGHTNIKQTQRYAKVLAESVFNDFEMVRNKIK